mmetsp:Transcript_6223/g.14957  ORF Transcript_6223/g.14957 Transcript_6223/m.14957 type:complete len:213 (+) Transcript_6223:1521-2159(+)
MISTPSYPARLARAAHRTKSAMVLWTPDGLSSLAGKGDMGLLVADADTAKGWMAYRPVCRICMQMRAGSVMVDVPSSEFDSGPLGIRTECTASVTNRCRSISASLSILAANGPTQPALLGEMPPVTMRPTPPSARRRKYSAMPAKSSCVTSGLRSGMRRDGMECPSRPVCIDPMRTRLGRVPMSGPRDSGSNMRGKCGAVFVDASVSLTRST